jgi:hypothetical protein
VGVGSSLSSKPYACCPKYIAQREFVKRKKKTKSEDFFCASSRYLCPNLPGGRLRPPAPKLHNVQSPTERQWYQPPCWAGGGSWHHIASLRKAPLSPLLPGTPDLPGKDNLLRTRYLADFLPGYRVFPLLTPPCKAHTRTPLPFLLSLLTVSFSRARAREGELENR